MGQVDTKQTLLDVKEVAEILGVATSWLYGRIHSSSLPFRYPKVGVYVRFLKSDVDDYIQGQLISKNT